MSKLYRYTISRLSIVEESYTVEADSEDEAVEGSIVDYDRNKVGEEFIDWYGNDGWRIVNKETLCPLTKMIKEHDTILPSGTATASST
jgi:hypothetical protein